MTFWDILSSYTMLYPTVMAAVWTVGGLYYFFVKERRTHLHHAALFNPNYCPTVTIMVPCYNEGANIEEVVRYLLNINYPNFEILLINDGSKDDTASHLDRLQTEDERIQVFHQKNQGKATALNNAIRYAQGEVLICIDGDAVLDYDAIIWMVRHFENNPKLGAVTGNPRVRTRSTVIGQLQVAEFSAIIGLIKRTQRLYGTVFTVSGVIVAFSKKAVQKVGGWSPDMITEDIDISWKLQSNGYNIEYEPQALCWVLMPETLKGLFNQRLRWAQGGAEVFFKYGMRSLLSWRLRRFWPLVLEYMASLLWCYALIGLFVAFLFRLNPSSMPQVQLLQGSTLMMLVICMLQFVASLFIDSHYDQKIWKSFFWCIWYPFAYWMLNFTTMCIAVPRALLKKKGQLAVWESPDRGQSI